VELAEIVLYVSDMERAIRFYRDTIRLEVDVESEDWTTFRTGACTLALHLVEQRGPASASPIRRSPSRTPPPNVSTWLRPGSP
jgi:catechol 2,3-dioxygenase-like lactoylglutathione lyase family enzyme